MAEGHGQKDKHVPGIEYEDVDLVANGHGIGSGDEVSRQRASRRSMEVYPVPARSIALMLQETARLRTRKR